MTRVNESRSAVPGPSEPSEANNRSGVNQGNDLQPSAPGTLVRKRPVRRFILIALIVVGGIVALIYWLTTRQYESTDDAFIEGTVIAVSPKVSAIVQRVYINDNDRVKKGDLLVELDARDYEAALAQAEGDSASTQGKLLEAQAQVQVSQADVGEAQAEVLVAQANAQNAQNDLNRFLALDERARSKQQMDNAIAAQRTTAAEVEDAKAKLTAAKAQMVNAQMAVQTAEGNLKAADGALQQARNNVGYCKIHAETDGVITRKNVDPGIYIQVDQPMFSIVEYEVWVVANFKETQLDRIEPGQSVEISVDAFPGRKITGKVQSVQNGTGARFSLLPPENATGNYVKIVQRVPVKIVLDPHQNDDPNHLLSPGMSVDPSIKVE
ncbi:MAG: HlyD family secretion protein [Tepidisphaeraceae bacterium]|jgi:membrane fusion protein (multidrug efflux system)